ncbi:MAG: sulfatase [Opitutales bacterium]|nr:sulfatase [Opitutales bacterium]
MNHSPRPRPLHIAFALSLLLATQFLQGQSAPKPNIVYIMADDLGWADVGFNGASFYETPNIDALAAQGMRFSDAYPGASNCMPSRACIMTGTYITRTQMWTPGSKAKGKKENMKFLVPRNGAQKGDGTLPTQETLDPSFTTIAKVLNTSNYTTAHLRKWHLGPETHGFDLNDTNGLGGGVLAKYYNDIDVAETLTNRAVQFIADESENPFFIYLCHWDVHTPIKARPEVVAKYDKKFKSRQWDYDWNTTYAAMIEAVDTSVGRVYEALRIQGVADNTLFIFTSDNGGHAGATPNKPLHGAKGAFYEGGIRVPMFAVWPNTVKAGTICETPITGVDYLPTFAALAGAALPKNQPIDGRSIVPLLKGKNALQKRSIFWHYPLYLAGNAYNLVVPIHGTDTMYWRATPSSVIRKGDWKLIQYFESNTVELYNLRKDIGESNELSKTYPEKASALLSELERWQKKSNAIIPTQINPDFDG